MILKKTILSEAFTYVHYFTTCTVLHVYSFCGWSGQTVSVTAVISGLTHMYKQLDKRVNNSSTH